MPGGNPYEDYAASVDAQSAAEAAVVPEQYNTVTIPGTVLNKTVEGEKNEFLFIQQALCVGPIQGVYDVLIDDGLGLTEPSLGAAGYEDLDAKPLYQSAAMRFDIHNGNGEEADNILVKNFPSRYSAKFPNTANASICVKLDRENPQFNGVPNAQFFIEGKLVRDITRSGSVGAYTYALTGFVYSNNSALCLLDYLLLSEGGKGLSVLQIDLESFYDARVLCDTPVLDNALIGGRIWRPESGRRSVSQRNLPLYECNIVIDTEKTIRENVEAILNTMGDARLVWSQSKYKLVVAYPASNAAIPYSGEITDDELVLGEPIDISWPTSSERLNFCTVRFRNESMDFKEDSVSWPPKQSGTYLRGIGAYSYPIVTGWPLGETTSVFMNANAVWTGGTDNTFVWKFAVKNSGAHTLDIAVDDDGLLNVRRNGILESNATNVGTGNNWRNFVTRSFNWVEDDIIEVTILANNYQGRIAGVAGRVLNVALQAQIWTTRSPAYTDFVTVNQDKTVYDEFLTEDNNILLEADIFADGISDYYHALAKAEEMVRTSRSAFIIEFTYKIKDRYYEPGDFVKLTSSTLNFDELPLKTDEIKSKDDFTATVKATRFDYTQLAWNVNDNEYIAPKAAYDFLLNAPSEVVLDREIISNLQSSGTVRWKSTGDSKIIGYIVYVNKGGDNDANGYPLFTEVGRTGVSEEFELPTLGYMYGGVGVKAISNTSSSKMTVNAQVIFNNRKIALTSSDTQFIRRGPVDEPSTITLTAHIAGYVNPVIHWYKNDVLLSNSSTTLVISSDPDGLSVVYRLTVEESEFVWNGEHRTALYSTITIATLSVGNAAFTDYIFRRALTMPATPTEQGMPAGWYDTPPTPNGNPLWVTWAEKDSDGFLITSWVTPVNIESGDIHVQYSKDGIADWHDVFAPGDLFIHYNVNGGAWSAAIQISFEGIDYLTTHFIFTRSLLDPPILDNTADEPIGWLDAPPTNTLLGPLWFSTGQRYKNGQLSNVWSPPVKLEGEGVIAEYSVTGLANWHPIFQEGDFYGRYKVGDGDWSIAARIVAENGTYVSYIFKRSATDISGTRPTGNDPTSNQGWFDAPPAANVNGDPLWASFANKTLDDVVIGLWSFPVQLEGGAFKIEYSDDGLGDWNVTFNGTTHKWARVSQDNGAHWSPSYKIVGEDGTSFVLKGTKATVGDLPVSGNAVGDIWIVTADGNGYAWDGDSWNNVGSIQGPEGAAGKYSTFVFKRAPATPVPTTPTGNDPTAQGWLDFPPAADNGKPLWVSTTYKTAAGVLISPGWTTPVQLEGSAVKVQYSDDAAGTNGWFDTFNGTTHKWAHYSTDGGFNWSASIKIVGEDGADAIYVDLTSESDVTAAEADGTGYVLPSSNQLKLYVGGVHTTVGVTYGGNGTVSGLTASINTSGVITFSGASWTSDTVEFTFTATLNSISYSAKYTYAKSRKGSDSIFPDLLSEADVISANLSGVLTASLPTGNKFNLHKGGFIIPSAQVVFGGSTTRNGLTLNIGASTGVITLTQNPTWTSLSESFVLTATYGPPGSEVVYSKIYTISKAQQGATGDAGSKGDTGEQGAPTYTWVAYANDANGTTLFSTTDPVGRAYIGLAFNQLTPTPEAWPGYYTWSLIKGEQGIPGVGIQGPPSYTWIAYANNATGLNFNTGAWTNETYIGIAVNKSTADESGSVWSDYVWSKIQGSKGDTGNPGQRTIILTCYKWYMSAPAVNDYTQVVTYTWAGGPISYPGGTIAWATAAPANTLGEGASLYQLELHITDLTGISTQTVSNWSAAKLNVIGYTPAGIVGANGQSARKAYKVTTILSPAPSVTAGVGDAAPTGGWSFIATTTLASYEYQFTVDGILTPGGNITWGNPYLASWKVGNLAAIAVDTGALNVSLGMTISNTGSIASSDATAFGTGVGIWQGYEAGQYKARWGNPTGARVQWTGTNFQVYNTNNQLVLSAGGAVWDYVTGTGKPANNAGTVIDGSRATNPQPQEFPPHETFYLKDAASIQHPTTYGSLGILRTVRPYGPADDPDLTGGAVNQWFEINGMVGFRKSTNATTWGSWEYVPNGKIKSSNVTTFIDSAAIGWAQIGNLDINANGYLRSVKPSYGSATAGIYLAYNNGVPHLDIGDSTKYFRWSGTDLLVGGDIIATGNIKARNVTNSISNSLQNFQLPVTGGNGAYQRLIVGDFTKEHAGSKVFLYLTLVLNINIVSGVNGGLASLVVPVAVIGGKGAESYIFRYPVSSYYTSSPINIPISFSMDITPYVYDGSPNPINIDINYIQLVNANQVSFNWISTAFLSGSCIVTELKV